MANLSHIMPNPLVIPILWGHEYLANPKTAPNVLQMISDLVTGPFMNGLAQYGIQRGSVRAPIVIDDLSPPARIVYYDSSHNLQDDITKQLIKWIKAGFVPPPASHNDIDQLYIIIPPIESTVQTYNNKDDPTGNGIQGFHNVGVTNPGAPPTYFWAMVKTDWARATPTQDVTPGVAPTICHELVEQLADRNGTFKEIGDPCNNNAVVYRGWNIQQYWSDWDNNCINGDAPVSLKKFLTALGFDFTHKGLRALGTPIINLNYIALTMQSH